MDGDASCDMAFVVLCERDFYPPGDDRTYRSGIDDVDGGDCFYDYVERFWEEYGEDVYDDVWCCR